MLRYEAQIAGCHETANSRRDIATRIDGSLVGLQLLSVWYFVLGENIAADIASRSLNPHKSQFDGP
jgi:hypothetical protein